MHATEHQRPPRAQALDTPAPADERRESGYAAAAAMAALGVTCAVGAFLPWTLGMHDAIPAWLASGSFALAAVLALGTAVLELVRARRSETFAAFSVALGIALTWASMTNGWYYFSPFMVLFTLLAILALASRAMRRDELRHVNRDDTHHLREGIVAGRAGPEHSAEPHHGRGPRSRSRGRHG